MSKEWKDLTLEDEMQETMMLADHIEEKVRRIGRDNATHKIIKSLNVDNNKTEVEKQEIQERIEHYLGNLHDLCLFQTYTYGNDIARALALKLGILRGLKVNEHNVLSFHPDSRQYSPQKNGLNILKHGLSFDDVMSVSDGLFGRLSVAVFEDGEQRNVVFTKVPNKDKYIVSIVKFHGSLNGESDLELEIAKITEDVLGEKVNTDDISIEQHLTQDDLLEVMRRAEHLREDIHNTEPMTFISSWYFDINKFDETVTNRIRFTGDHDVRDPKAAAKEMKLRALEILKKAWGISPK